jgi:hypothetical protein
MQSSQKDYVRKDDREVGSAVAVLGRTCCAEAGLAGEGCIPSLCALI